MPSLRLDHVREEAKKKKHINGWVLEKQESSWAPAGTWSNIDLDVTPVERRTWTSWTIFGYWFSDIISIQSWQTGSTILALGLTWLVFSPPRRFFIDGNQARGYIRYCLWLIRDGRADGVERLHWG